MLPAEWDAIHLEAHIEALPCRRSERWVKTETDVIESDNVNPSFKTVDLCSFRRLNFNLISYAHTLQHLIHTIIGKNAPTTTLGLFSARPGTVKLL